MIEHFESARPHKRLPRARKVLSLCAAAITGIAVASCGPPGPSRGVAEGLLKDSNGIYAASYFMATVDPDSIHVKDIKCTKTGNDVYECQVLATAQYQGQPVQAQRAYQFVKLGGNWSARPTDVSSGG